MKAAFGYLAALVLIVVLALTRALVVDDTPVVAAPPSAAAEIAAVELAPRGHVGVVVAAHTTDVATANLALVVDVVVALGDHVEAGAPLVVLDARAAKHELAAAALEEQQLRELSTRGATLLEKGVVSREEATQMGFAARAKAAHARRARVSVDAAVLRAPFAGTVVERRVERGMVLDAGVPALRIVSDGPTKLRFGVPPRHAAALHVGDEVWFRDATDDGVPALRARIDGIADEVDRSTELVMIEAGVHGTTGLRSGTQVRVFTSFDLDGAEAPGMLLGRAVASQAHEPEPATPARRGVAP